MQYELLWAGTTESDTTENEEEDTESDEECTED